MCAIADGRHPDALFDPEDLDFIYVERWWHFVLAILSMGPAYLLLFVLSPYRAVRWLGLAMLQALRVVFQALRGLIRIAQR
jgi:pyrroline-5-carboxylate reductase